MASSSSWPSENSDFVGLVNPAPSCIFVAVAGRCEFVWKAVVGVWPDGPLIAEVYWALEASMTVAECVVYPSVDLQSQHPCRRGQVPFAPVSIGDRQRVRYRSAHRLRGTDRPSAAI